MPSPYLGVIIHFITSYLFSKYLLYQPMKFNVMYGETAGTLTALATALREPS